MTRTMATAVLVIAAVACGGGGTLSSVAADPLVPAPSRAPVTTASPSATPTTGAPTVPSNTTTPPTAPTTATTVLSTTPPSPVSDIPPGQGVAIEAVGTVVEDRRGRVLCPFEETGACAGLPLSGHGLPRVGDQVRVGGRYDGASLEVAYIEPWSPKEYGPLLNPCTGETNRDQAGPEPERAISAVIEGHQDRYVGAWIADGQVVVALTGPDDELAEELRQIEDLCVVTGYEYSSVELNTLAEELTPLLREMAPPYAYVDAVGVPETKIVVEGDAVDSDTIALLTDRYGPIEVETFITVLDAPVSDLPDQQPLVPGDVSIPTAAMRVSGFSMTALWLGVSLEYDRDLNCLYAGDGSARTVVIWPNGHTAVAGDQVQVFDPAGNVVAETGKARDIGGGNVGIEQVDPAQRCDATDAFLMGGVTAHYLSQLSGG